MSYSGYDEIEYYGNGNYKLMYVQVDTVWLVGKRKVKSLAGESVKFHYSGQIKELVLADEIKARIGFTSVRIMKHTKITFDEEGFIESFIVADQQEGFFSNKHDWEYGGHCYSPGTLVTLAKCSGTMDGIRVVSFVCKPVARY